MWSQGDTRASESPIIIDGERVGEREGNEAFSYISTVNGICKWTQVEENKIKKNVEPADEVSPSFKVFLNKHKDLLITSHFTDVDDAARRIVYAFCSKGLDFQKAADLIGRSCNTADIKLLERWAKNLHDEEGKKNKTMIIVLILLALMIILTIILLFHFGYINFNTIESLWTKIKNN